MLTVGVILFIHEILPMNQREGEFFKGNRSNRKPYECVLRTLKPMSSVGYYDLLKINITNCLTEIDTSIKVYCVEIEFKGIKLIIIKNIFYKE